MDIHLDMRSFRRWLNLKNPWRSFVLLKNLLSDLGVQRNPYDPNPCVAQELIAFGVLMLPPVGDLDS